MKEQDDRGRNLDVACGQHLTVCRDEVKAPLLSEIHMKEELSHSESSTGKGTTFRLTVAAIMAVIIITKALN